MLKSANFMDLSLICIYSETFLKLYKISTSNVVAEFKFYDALSPRSMPLAHFLVIFSCI